MINDELSVRCACFFCRKSCIFVEWAAAIYHFNTVYGTDSERLAAVVFPQCDGGKIELCGCCTANNSMFIQLVALWDFCRWENGFSSFLWILRKANKYFFIENKKRIRGASWCFTLAHSCVMCRLKCICVIATQSWVSRQIHNSLSDRIILISKLPFWRIPTILLPFASAEESQRSSKNRAVLLLYYKRREIALAFSYSKIIQR